MTWALWLLMLQGILGALDTLYYHEWRARLVAYGPRRPLSCACTRRVMAFMPSS